MVYKIMIFTSSTFGNRIKIRTWLANNILTESVVGLVGEINFICNFSLNITAYI